jgi:predicted ATP-grasp superfamily ATP-dependent carboligase
LPDPLDYPQPPAVVVGACGHGLAVMRALHEGAVPIIALEANPALPGNRTRLAKVLHVPDINGPGLITALQSLHERIRCPANPVLFLTNDTMVRTVGEHWGALDGHFALSWADTRSALLPLLQKPALESRCNAVGLNYPETFVIRSPADVAEAVLAIGFPMIVKPSRPLSRFKTALPGSQQELRALVERLESDLPFLVQQFVPGDDTHIYFSALYLDRGKVCARFDGHKLRSRPLGHTTIAESASDDNVFAHTCRFFDGLGLSGPVSLELKRDGHGRLWVIEPTVGRTDFWLGLCTANGVNLPLTEYHHQCGATPPMTRQSDAAVWFNEDRDPLGRVWVARHAGGGMRGRRSTYTFLNRGDPAPAIAFLRRTAIALLRSATRPLRR